MIPQHASSNTTMGFAAPSANGGADDIFARTQRILEAARAVQMTADNRPATMMNFGAPMPTPTVTDTDDFALLSDDELSSEDLEDLFPMPELVANAFGMVTGGVPDVAGEFESAPL